MDPEQRSHHSSTESPDVLLASAPTPQLAHSCPVQFISLPRSIRDKIYERVLTVAHPIYLFQDAGSSVVNTFVPEILSRWLALLYTNRQVHDEASALLFGLNHFIFMDTMQRQDRLIQSFANCIGSLNACALSHLSINFPVLENIDNQPAQLMKDDLHSLELLREKCTGLRTLETLVYNRSSRCLMNKGLDDSQSVREALSQISMQLRAMPSLKKIIVRFYNGSPTPLVVTSMQSLGWIVCLGDAHPLK